MTRSLTCVLLAMLAGGPATVARADDALTPAQQQALVVEAQAAFDRGVSLTASQPEQAQAAFADAAARYQRVVDGGVHNARLHYNLANAYLQAGAVGKAIAQYRRAEHLAPGDERVAHNLAYARTKRGEPPVAAASDLPILSTLTGWLDRVPLRVQVGVALAAYAVFWVVLLVRLFVRQVRWRFVIVPAVVLWVGFGTYAGMRLVREAVQPAGVIIAADTVLRKGNAETFEPVRERPLPDGVEFGLLERRGEWLHIELPGGQTGWVRGNQAETL